MGTLPTRFAAVILCFARLFRQRSWRWAEQLLAGALLVPGARTVATVCCGCWAWRASGTS